MSDQTSAIVQEEISAQGKPSLRKFADWLTEGMSKEGENQLSHATVINWINGKAPQTDFLQDMLSIYEPNDRRFIFALRMLAAKSPHIWGLDGIVWRLHKMLKLSIKA